MLKDNNSFLFSKWLKFLLDATVISKLKKNQKYFHYMEYVWDNYLLFSKCENHETKSY